MKNLTKTSNLSIVIFVIILSILGIIGIYSSGYNSNYSGGEYIKQIVWVLVGMSAMTAIYFIDYNTIGVLGYGLYLLVLVLLGVVLFTTPVNGSSSWFDFGLFKFQPSELMKIAYILVLGKFLEYIILKNRKEINKLYSLAITFGIFVVPIVLILLQPDLGTAVVFISITVFMLFFAGLNYKYILIAGLIIIILAPSTYFFVLNDYQQKRIIVFLNPEKDPLGSGYNAIQSKLAIGSGMIFGTGILKGTQTQFGYLPVKSSDFIFAVISEEMGFLISSFIVVIYILLLIKIVKVAHESKDSLGGLICIGVFGMLFFHFIENIGMTMGLLPITGIPLPFVSYGGSSTLVNFIAIGLVLSVSKRSSKSLF